MSNDTITHKYGTVTFGQVNWDAFADNNGAVNYVKATATFRTQLEAEAFAFRFAKSLRVRKTTLSADYEGAWKQYGYVTFEACLGASNVNGGVNETGMKRIRGFFKALANMSITPVRVKHCANSVDFSW
jgi:hypothetical protein